MYRNVNRAMVEDRAQRIRRSTGKNYQIDWSGAPVRPRMHLNGRDISPRLTKGEFMIWSDGFLEGRYSMEGGHDGQSS